MDTFDILQIPEEFPNDFCFKTHWKFFDAEKVSTFMWGRSLGNYAIYKNGNLASLTHLYPDMLDLKNYLINF
jgi:hypothetical protein